MKNDKEALRKKIRDSINKKYSSGDDDKFILNAKEDSEKLKPTFLSTGIEPLDEVLGGGWVKGGVAVVHGIHFCGKTAVALSTAREVVKNGGLVLYVCTEPPYPTNLAALIGLPEDNDQLDVITPKDFGEQIVNSIIEFLRDKDTGKLHGIYDLIIIDSINNVVPKSVIDTADEKGAEKDAQMARRAKMYTDFLERLMGQGLLRNGAVLLCVAQDRANMDANTSKYIPTSLSAPWALKYDAKQTIKLTKTNTKQTDKATNKSVIIGHTVDIEVEKNSTTGKLGRAQYSVIYGEGIDDSAAVCKKAEFKGLVRKDKDKGRGWVVIPLANGDWSFAKIADFRERAKIDKVFKQLVKDALAERGYNLENPKPLNGFYYEPPTVDVELEDTDELSEEEIKTFNPEIGD